LERRRKEVQLGEPKRAPPFAKGKPAKGRPPGRSKKTNGVPPASDEAKPRGPVAILCLSALSLGVNPFVLKPSRSSDKRQPRLQPEEWSGNPTLEPYSTH